MQVYPAVFVYKHKFIRESSLPQETSGGRTAFHCGHIVGKVETWQKAMPSTSQDTPGAFHAPSGFTRFESRLPVFNCANHISCFFPRNPVHMDAFAGKMRLLSKSLLLRCASFRHLSPTKPRSPVPTRTTRLCRQNAIQFSGAIQPRRSVSNCSFDTFRISISPGMEHQW